ncbi:MAG: methyltransferase domain-containing protein [Planctomycetia bacterium]|nr:methyltransferase domain-containing protein [Planctomycetia bacterium]MCC7314696.1 methyltransferase domain-containing protein [Planctomycetota bacterium]
MTTQSPTHETVREYYGRVLKRSSDLKTDACCSPNGMPGHIRSIMTQLAPEIVERFYGCGSPIPQGIEGCTILDLGCGTGRDAFICAKLAGPRGRVIGLDMTAEQLSVAQANEESQAAAFGFGRPNTRFVQGYMESLGDAGIEDESVDVVISNCVLNLSSDKECVFSEILRVLKPGGELLFSDIFADRRLSIDWREDQVLLGECLAGAMYVEDFRRLLHSLGVLDYRIVARRPVSIDNEMVKSKVGMARFDSLTIRAFKIKSLEDRCEDFGQVATYLGTVAHCPHSYVLDDHHEFITGKPMLVCGNTAAMLSETRLAIHFRVQSDRTQHFGLFPCGKSPTLDAAIIAERGCC